MRPNILTVLVDDMGFSDIGCFGGEIETPHLDSLAANGVRLTQFYNCARCCPARASLLTGLYPHQAGVGMMVYRDHGDGYEGNLNDRCVTFAEVLRSAGYQTMLVGKWHTGHEPRSRPEVRGFDRFTGVYPHIDSYWEVLAGCDIYRLIDVMPTLCGLAGAEYPQTHEGRAITPAQGISMAPFLLDTTAQAEPRTPYWQHESTRRSETATGNSSPPTTGTNPHGSCTI